MRPRIQRFPSAVRVADLGEGVAPRNLADMPKRPVNHPTVEAEQFAWLLHERNRVLTHPDLAAARAIVLCLRPEVLEWALNGRTVTHWTIVKSYRRIMMALERSSNLMAPAVTATPALPVGSPEAIAA